MPSRRVLAPLAHAVSFFGLCFPAAAPAQQILQGEENLLHRAPVDYPTDALEKRIPGTVVAQATLNDRGVVMDAQIMSGPAVFRKPVLKSVLDWHYSPGTPSPVQVVVDFAPPEQRLTLLNGQPVAIAVAAPPNIKTPPNMDAGIVKRLQFIGVLSQVQETVADHLAIREGDTFQTNLVSQIQESLRKVDEHLKADFRLLDFDGERRYFELLISYAAGKASYNDTR